MKIVTTCIICISFCFCCHGQKQNFTRQIDSLKTIEAMPYFPELSGDDAFWNLTKGKLDIVPYLLDRITDTTSTAAYVPNFGGVYTIGDACVTALHKIIKDFPTIKLIESNPKILKEKAYGIYWGYVRSGFKNRVEFKKRARAWYEKNKRLLVWQPDDKLYATSDDENGESRKLPAGGYYVLKE
jgi:hypothetical protein